MATINYKEKYEKAVHAAMLAKQDTESAVTIRTLEEIFPELKESEDERIRKWLIELVEEVRKANPTNVEHNGMCSEALAWLEKQAEHANFRNKIQIGDKVTRNKDGYLVNLSQLNRVAKVDEKQGEQKPNYNNKELKDVVIAELSKYNSNDLNAPWATDSTGLQYPLYFANLGAKWQEEQKPADKVEPKFKVGDWVVYDHRTYQVVELPKEGYINLCLRRNGKIEFAPSTYCRHWTIQDANDGDVLSYITDEEDLWIMIYRSLYEPYEGHVHYHALLVNDNFTDKGTCCICIDDLKPATKEQRDLLFQKMKEAGYEWDAEKKELKKIEQKPAECLCVPSREIIMNVWELGNIWKELTGGNISTEHGTQLEYIQKHWTEGDYFDKIEQKPAWSEEDERHIGTITSLLEDRKKEQSDWGIEVLNEEIAWLKSLKGRVQPQPKHEWSEEDAIHYNRILKELILQKEMPINASVIEEVKSDIIWFKSLRPQNRWKPSEFHLECISDAIAIYEERGINAIGLKEILDELKKLREEQL